jgi:hypothetical protein
MTVPARHDRRADRAPAVHVDRPGHADTHREHVGGAPIGLGQQRLEAILEPAQHRPGAVRDPQRLLALGERHAREVADGEAPVPGAEVGGEDDPHVLVEGQGDRRAPAARLPASLEQQAGGQQQPEAVRDGRAREAGQVHHLVARARAAVADEPEHLPRGTVRNRGWDDHLAHSSRLPHGSHVLLAKT